MNITQKIITIVIAVVLLFSGIVTPIASIKAETPQERLEALQRELDRIKSEKSALQNQLNNNNYTISGYNSQVSKLQGEIALYQKDIDALAIEIEQLETTIEDLNNQIAQMRGDIKSTETVVTDLDIKSNNRIRNSYMNYRMYGTTDPGTSAIIINDINRFFKESQYKELIQEDTNEMLVQLARLKQELEVKKAELEESLIQVEKDKELVDIKKLDLDKKKEDIQENLNKYYSEVARLQAANNQSQSSLKSLSDEERMLSAKAELIKQEIMMSVSYGTWVLAGTIIGFQGCTGYCFGEHLHFSVYYNGVAVNPCGVIQPTGGCGGNGYPLQAPVRGSVSFNSGFGWRSFDNAFHDGIDVTGMPLGAPIYAAHDGYVTRGLDCWHRDRGYPTNGCATYVKISQNNGSNSGYVTGYWHLKAF